MESRIFSQLLRFANISHLQQLITAFSKTYSYNFESLLFNLACTSPPFLHLFISATSATNISGSTFSICSLSSFFSICDGVSALDILLFSIFSHLFLPAAALLDSISTLYALATVSILPNDTTRVVAVDDLIHRSISGNMVGQRSQTWPYPLLRAALRGALYHWFDCITIPRTPYTTSIR